jgi:Flp pilus assembly protein TadG
MHRSRRTPAAFLGHEDGAAAVEFAIIMTLLFIIVFGIVEFGIAFSKLNVYIGAAREGARYAAVRCQPDTTTGCSDALIAARVDSSAVGYAIGPGSPSEDVVCSSANIGAFVTVSWTQNITVDIPFLPGLNPITYTRTVRGVFRCE